MSHTLESNPVQTVRKLLNVGGADKNLPIPDYYTNWDNVILDIDTRGNPDIVCDARNLVSLEANTYDAVYCSHNLEHYYRHDVFKVLKGFLHVIKDDGFVHIRVPDIREVMVTMLTKNLDIDDTLYQSPAGPITVGDVIYGWSIEIEQSGQDFYAHKTGFTSLSLRKILHQVGFAKVYMGKGDLEVVAIGFKQPPSDYAKKLLNIK